jgi:hypothetical protein
VLVSGGWPAPRLNARIGAAQQVGGEFSSIGGAATFPLCGPSSHLGYAWAAKTLERLDRQWQAIAVEWPNGRSVFPPFSHVFFFVWVNYKS